MVLIQNISFYLVVYLTFQKNDDFLIWFLYGIGRPSLINADTNRKQGVYNGNGCVKYELINLNSSIRKISKINNIVPETFRNLVN